jgi:hypothetical protein
VSSAGTSCYPCHKPSLNRKENNKKLYIEVLANKSDPK